MGRGEFTSYQRRLPHWRLTGATYFITFRMKGASHLALSEIKLVCDHIVTGHRRFYELLGVVVMPDHAHALLEPLCKFELGRIVKGIKGASARKINQGRGTTGSVWQDEAWDRIIRDNSELHEKLKYMLENPVKKGLTDDPWNWPGWWCREKETEQKAS